MKLQVVNKSYNSLEGMLTYKVSYDSKNASITVTQSQGVGSTLYLTPNVAKTLVMELNQLIDEVEFGQKEEFNENP